MDTLQNQIAEFRRKFKAMVSEEKVKIIENGLASQKLNLGLEGIAKVGDTVSDFNFTSIDGQKISLAGLLKNGSLILNFYRGGWCPYCNLELRSYESILPKLEVLCTNLIALSPEKTEKAQITSQTNKLTFPLGTDEGLRIAKSFGLVFELSEELKELYEKFGHALSEVNSEGLWELPVPATFVIEPNRKISFAYVNLDYRERLEPTEILKFLEQRRP